MPMPLEASTLLDQEYLQTRAMILSLAASLDRLQRAQGSVGQDPRIRNIEEALEVLMKKSDDRAETVQLIFSLQYDDEWQRRFGLPTSK